MTLTSDSLCDCPPLSADQRDVDAMPARASDDDTGDPGQLADLIDREHLAEPPQPVAAEGPGGNRSPVSLNVTSAVFFHGLVGRPDGPFARGRRCDERLIDSALLQLLIDHPMLGETVFGPLEAGPMQNVVFESGMQGTLPDIVAWHQTGVSEPTRRKAAAPTWRPSALIEVKTNTSNYNCPNASIRNPKALTSLDRYNLSADGAKQFVVIPYARAISLDNEKEGVTDPNDPRSFGRKELAMPYSDRRHDSADQWTLVTYEQINKELVAHMPPGALTLPERDREWFDFICKLTRLR